MIKKVGNWVFGSFFRTMGRFFFFLFFGFMLAMIISKNNISIKWTDLLGIETIDALTYTTEVKTVSSSYFDINNPSDFTCATWDSCQFEITSSDSNPIGSKTIQISSNYNTKDKDFIGFYTLISQPVQIVATETYAESICQKWTQSGTTYTCSQLSGVTEYNTLLQNSILLGTNFQFKVEYTDNNNAYCDLDGNEIICPTFKKQIARLIISWNFKTHYTTYALFRFNKIANNMYYNSPTGAIESQTQQQQQQHNETISTITDSNTTEASSEATNFFGNFNSQDNGGISSIITAPLSAISGLVSATCTPITLPLPYLDNKTIVLPCMSAIYQEHFGAFFTIYQTIIFGAIAYRIVVSLFMMIQGFKNPDDDKIEVVDL